MSLVLTNANLIDAVTQGVTTDATVIIEDDRIADIASRASADRQSTAQVIDLRRAFLLPGLWDVHIHPEYPVPPGTTTAQERSLA